MEDIRIVQLGSLYLFVGPVSAEQVKALDPPQHYNVAANVYVLQDNCFAVQFCNSTASEDSHNPDWDLGVLHGMHYLWRKLYEMGATDMSVWPTIIQGDATRLLSRGQLRADWVTKLDLVWLSKGDFRNLAMQLGYTANIGSRVHGVLDRLAADSKWCGHSLQRTDESTRAQRRINASDFAHAITRIPKDQLLATPGFGDAGLRFCRDLMEYWQQNS
jgi:hypothetical protein